MKDSYLTQFTDLGLSPLLLKALAAEGYEKPTPIQAQAIPHLLTGRDLLGIAQTGTGKTAAFALPILHMLATDRRPPAPRTCRALILSPTRELASQIADSFRTYSRNIGGVRVGVVFGGVGHRPQADQMGRGLDILVATPGRLIDHLDSRNVNLSKTEVFVLDEADRMLDMGFIHALRRIVPNLPKTRQSLFFSATMPKEISGLAGDLLSDPVRVSVTPAATTAERVNQQVIFVEVARKRALLAELLRGEANGRTLVFTRTKHGADRVVRQLEQDGFAAAAIHGNKSQSQRERALAGFRSGAMPVLVATDIAARGIDVDGVAHVINFDLPNEPESYVHRIGRTARAGAEGAAISFCANDERAYLRDIERITRQKIPAIDRRLAPGEADAERPAPRQGAGLRRDDGDRSGSRRPSGAPAKGKSQANGRNRKPGGQPQRGAGRDNGKGDGRGDDLSNVAFLKTSRGPAEPKRQGRPQRQRRPQAATR